jgi:hypothetical protein
VRGREHPHFLFEALPRRAWTQYDKAMALEHSLDVCLLNICNHTHAQLA